MLQYIPGVPTKRESLEAALPIPSRVSVSEGAYDVTLMGLSYSEIMRLAEFLRLEGSPR